MGDPLLHIQFIKYKKNSFKHEQTKSCESRVYNLTLQWTLVFHDLFCQIVWDTSVGKPDKFASHDQY